MDWFRKLRQIFGRSAVLRRRIKEEPDLMRSLMFTGFMVIHGQPIQPHRWDHRGIVR